MGADEGRQRVVNATIRSPDDDTSVRIAYQAEQQVRGLMPAARLTHQRGRARLLAIFLLFALAAARLAGEGLAAGRFLVAGRQVSDPNFAGTVVLLIHYDKASAMGLIVNRRSTVSLSSAFSGMGETNNKSDPIYIGGPVGKTRALALARSRAAPAGSTRVLADVYLISERPHLEKTLAAGARSDVFRVYLGYAGWTAGRLEREVAAGWWHIVSGEAGLVFDPEPEPLWRRLMRRLEGPLALSRGMCSQDRIQSAAGCHVTLISRYSVSLSAGRADFGCAASQDTARIVREFQQT